MLGWRQSMNVFKICLFFCNCWLCLSLAWLYFQVVSLQMLTKMTTNRKLQTYILQLSNYSEKVYPFFHDSSKSPRTKAHFWVLGHVLQTEAREKDSWIGFILKPVAYTIPTQNNMDRKVGEGYLLSNKKRGLCFTIRKIKGRQNNRYLLQYLKHLTWCLTPIKPSLDICCY